jgi:hypothetical protein
MSNSVFKLFTSNYLQELPEDIKQLIYKRVYLNNYSIVLNELLANNDNLKHYDKLKQYIAIQEEPKLNLLNHLSQNIIRQADRGNSGISGISGLISCYKKHLTSKNISNAKINKLKIASNISKYLDKRISQTLITFLKKSKNIDDTGEYYVLEYGKHFCCLAELYLVLLTFWQFIRRNLYEFYELHKVAYNIHSNNLLKDNCNDCSITDSIYRKIIKHRRCVDKTECCYINFEIRNNIECYIIENDTILIKLKVL